jgi:hypothetical protein
VAVPPPPDQAPRLEPPLPTDEAIDALADLREPVLVVEEPGDVPLPDVEVEDAGVSPEEMVGAPEPGPPPLPPSPFDVDLDEARAPGNEVMAPAPPSWDEIVEGCIALARADAAMLIDPAGQVFAARGDWPAPGPETIATKLVSTMERALKDAPTRSISAPLSGRHLTAWRVPLAEGLVTVAFIGETPVRSETRPVIDTEIHRGAGA